MEIRYRCLVLDHDDTVVKSTPNIHYPSFVEALKVLRPNMKPLSLEEFVSHCFNPGFSELCKEILELNAEEQEYQYRVWRSYTESRVPEFYEGFIDIINDYKEFGGLIAVVSHSERHRIERDYRIHCNIEPDCIFGWELEEHQRKPNSYPVVEVMKAFNLKESEILVVDDLKPGLVMAKNSNIAFAAAGWSHKIPEIKEYMKSNSDYYFSTVESFRDFVFVA